MSHAGTVIAGRFELEARVGSGGMGEVYRARDRATGGIAAVKVLRDEAPEAHHERFVREARLLAELTHPSIVRYLAFGEASTGRPWLAMEWLDGEDLGMRLKREGIGARAAVDLAARVAAALATAHARGVIHRDIKPSNLFLVAGDPARVKVLDFGIARVLAAHDDMTRTGATIGTPKYMAPEQARGSRDVDARADLFSLGCVLFECLAGVSPFAGSTPAATLAKIVLDEAPRLGELRGDLPRELEELVGRMLAKDPARRPRDCAEVATTLEALGDLGETPHERWSARDSGVTTGEQRLVCVVFASRAVAAPEDIDPDETAAPPTVVDSPSFATATVGAPQTPAGVVRALANLVASYRARSEVLADGSVVVSLFGPGAATDQASRAARCALAMREIVPTAPMALAIGRCVVGDRIPLGELIDRATSLLRDAAPVRPIRVDEVSAGLLDVRFVIEGHDDGLALVGEQDVAAMGRLLLGKPSPCVGRERELAMLGAIFDECVAEPMSHAVVVTSPAGVGKSRLRYELVRRLANRGVEIWIGRGDPMTAGAPFAMLAQALRRAAGIVDDEPLAVRYRKLRARVSRHVAAEDVRRVTDFLGELVGAPSSSDLSVQLMAARHSPQLMGDQMLRACEDFFAAECAAQPVLLVLEDLQWSDLPTVQYVDAILRRLADRPLMVLALARPDVDVVFPRLWTARGVERIHLGELTRRASDKLVREALGAGVDPALVARIVDRAAGNAFYLEELIRSVAEGHGDRLPETVVAMVQARLEALELPARHVLRAASVFGQVFWRGGIASLVENGATHVDDWLDELVRRELVTARRDSRFRDEPEYTFRHSLVREAAYAMLPDRDRSAGHRLAGAWLAGRIGDEAADVEAVTLAEHFLRGDEPRKAVGWYRRAAEQALEGDDLENAIDRAERAIACVHAVGDTDSRADGELVGVLRQLQAGAHDWRGEYALAAERGAEALARLPRGSLPWLTAAAAVGHAHARRLEHEPVIELCHELATIPVAPAVHRAYTHAVANTMTTLLWHADAALVAVLFARLDHVEAESARDPVALAWIFSARAWRALRDGDHAASLELDRKCEQCFTLVGDFRHACQQHANVGYGELMIGAFEAAEHSLREALAHATAIGLHQVTSQAQHNLGLVLARRGKLDEARRVETAALEAFSAQGNHRLRAGALNYLAKIETAAGNFAVAIRHANEAIEVGAETATLCNYYATLATAQLRAGDPAAALASATTAMELVATHGTPEEGEASVRLAHAEALHATGRLDEARRAIELAASRLEAAAAKISHLDHRASYLAIEDHQRTVALLDAWGA